MTKSKGSREIAPGLERPETPPALPAWKAFVVQFTLETGVEPGKFAGRVEHLSSGQRACFDSSRGLLAFVEAVLHQPRLS
jgi:hypothetical protein